MEPTIRKTVDALGHTLWVVDGAGVRRTHPQYWQAAVFHHQLQSAGVSIAVDLPHVLHSSVELIETTQTLLNSPSICYTPHTQEPS